MAKAKTVAQADLPAQVGHMDAAQAKKWMSQQVPYRNFAGMSEHLDGLVESWVIGHRDRFRARMSKSMARWAVNYRAANGEAVWHEHEDDLHVPESKKALDSIVARTEEALLEFDPIFEVDGTRNDLPRLRSALIGANTYRLMEMARFREMVQPSTRDVQLTNVSCVKVDWEEVEELIVERKHELRFRKTGEPYWHDERRMRRAIAKRGPKYYLVDPFWLFYDIDAASVQDAEFIGDESEIFLHEIEAGAKAGKFKNWDRVKKHVASRSEGSNSIGPGTEWPDLLRRARSTAELNIGVGDNRGAQHTAQRPRAIECYGFFDFGDGFDGVTDPLGKRLVGTHRVRAMIVDNVCVRFQLNPFDKKFVPYAFARIVRNGHDLAGPANFDSVVQLNAQYDAIHSDLCRMLGRSVAPVIVTRNDSDLPDNILGVKAGSVLRATGDWEPIKMPEINGTSLSYWHGYMRREIEETSGALRVFESPQGTATETERKVQEQQRQIRSSIRAVGDLWKQVAQITHWMAAQFSTGPERFRVLGKAAQALGRTATITPDVLQEDVEFRFLGVESMHTFGSRIANMRQWTTTWASMLPNMPEVSIPALARLDFELSVGKAHVNEIFPNMTSPFDSMPQAEENAMLLAGHEVPINEHDNDEEHARETMALLERMERQNAQDYLKKNVMQHLMAHLEAGRRKAEQQAALERQAQQRGAVQQQLGGRPGIDRPPVEGGMSAQSVTPGPTQTRTMGRAGRENGSVSQSQQMEASA